MPMEQTMRTIVVGLLSVGLVVVLAGPGDAASKKYRHTYYSSAQRYPYASPRQLRMRGRIITPAIISRRTAMRFPLVAGAGGR